jgi:hypothetical protein
VCSSRRPTTFSVWRPAFRITTLSTLATVSSQYPLTAASRGTTVQVTPPTPTPISFAAHLLLQPPGPRRLLQKFDQHVSNTCMIEHLRFIKSKTISTDGGLSLIGQGTFGWVLTMPRERNWSQVQALSTILLPKRVPSAVSSMALPRHWNTSTNFRATTRCDLKASTTGNLTQRLGHNRSMTIKSTWVKAHQDENKLPGQVLPDAALRNIDVDSIANDYLLDI